MAISVISKNNTLIKGDREGKKDNHLNGWKRGINR